MPNELTSMEEIAGEVDAISRSQVIASFDMQGMILSANQNFLKLFGYTFPEIAGRHHSIFVEPGIRVSAAYRQFWVLLQNGQFQAGEYKRIGKDGREVWLQASYNPILGFDGRPLKILKLASDISENKRLQAALAAQVSAIDKSQAVAEFAPDGTILFANQNFLAELGYTLAEIQGKHHRTLVASDERDSPDYRRFWESLGHGEYQAGEYRRISKHGEEVWFQATYNPVFGLDGKVYKVVKLAMNITKQKLRSAANEGQVTALSRSQAVIEFDMDGRVLVANRNYLSLLGYDLAEIKGQHHSVFVEPAYRESAAYGLFWASLRKGEYQEAEFKRVRKDGRLIWLQASYNPVLDANGKPSRIVKFATDITARKLAETRVVALEAGFLALRDSPADAKLRLFEGFVRHMTVAMTITEAGPFGLPGPRIVYTNPAFTTMTGYSADEVIGQTPRILQGPLTAPESRAQIRRALDSWQPVQVELLNYRKDGTVFWLELSIAPLCDERGRYTHWISVQRDITDRKRLERELRESAERLTLATDSGRIGIWDWDIAGNTMLWDSGMYRLYGMEPGAAPATDALWRRHLHPDDAVQAEQAIRDCLESDIPYDSTFRIVWSDGSVKHIRAAGSLTCDSAGRPIRMVGANWDVTEPHALAAELADQNERIRVTLQSIGDGVITTDAIGRVAWLNPVAERLTGWAAPDAAGRKLAEVFQIVNEITRAPAPDPVAACLELDKVTGLPSHTLLIARDGTEFGIEDTAAPIRNTRGETLGAVLVFHDVTEARRISGEISFRASHDALTGLLNRGEFEVRLRFLLHKAHADDSEHALMLIDLDQFKLVNDSCGHAAGDKLLQQVTRLLGDVVRRSDTLARLGGDEFAIILEHCAMPQARILAQRICDRMEESRFIHGDRRFRVGASIGLVQVDRRWPDPAAVLQAADSSCFAAKEAGRNRVHLWSDTDQTMRALQGVTQLATRLAQALDGNQFVLFAQRIQPLYQLP